MRAAIVSCSMGLLLMIATQAFAQPTADRLDVAALRSDLLRRLLSEYDGPSAPILDHIWKSNGGALLKRDPLDPTAQAFALQLTNQIQWDASTGTIAWPVYGFAGVRPVHFTPVILWDVMAGSLLEPRYAKTDVDEFRVQFLAARDARPIVFDPLVAPIGLSMPAEHLLCCIGFCGSKLFVYTADQCFEVAMKCYFHGFYHDALVFLSHAIAQQQDARYYYFRGTIEMLLGRANDAKMSAIGYLMSPPVPVMGPQRQFYERINGPPAIQFRALAAASVRL